MPTVRRAESLALALVLSFGTALLAAAAPPAAIPGEAALTYADLADLADAAPLVARAQIRSVKRLDPEQARGARPGMARVLVKARTRALLVGAGLGESIAYLADLPLDAKGRLPKLDKREVLLFASPVAGRPGELRLVAPDAQLAWSQGIEDRLRAILTELVAPGAPPRVLGVREAMHVAGNLLGEGETQIFLSTQAGDPVSITVLRRPGAPPQWGVAFGEIVDQAARPPERDTLAWYRLACFLPAGVTPATILPGADADRRKAAEDYRYVRGQLGACPRIRPDEWRRR
ncbi:MAG TPA: hypothetical protein VM055_07150 [Novosphingobium sp.]|nr:hypothetical protein [Novosphingobium sp.]